MGKGNKTRSIPLDAGCKRMIDEWAEAGGIVGGWGLRSSNKGGCVGGTLTAQAVWDIVTEYAAVGLEVVPHDLRRTFAKLCLASEVPIEEIQLLLGHASLLTTQRYLGVGLDLEKAPKLGVKL